MAKLHTKRNGTVTDLLHVFAQGLFTGVHAGTQKQLKVTSNMIKKTILRSRERTMWASEVSTCCHATINQPAEDWATCTNCRQYCEIVIN